MLHTPDSYYDEIKDNEVDGECGAHERNRANKKF
jgi:hypothetical protein